MCGERALYDLIIQRMNKMIVSIHAQSIRSWYANQVGTDYVSRKKCQRFAYLTHSHGGVRRVCSQLRVPKI